MYCFPIVASSDVVCAFCSFSWPFSSALACGTDMFSSSYLYHLLSHSGNPGFPQIDLICRRFYMTHDRVPNGFRDFNRIKMVMNIITSCFLKI